MFGTLKLKLNVPPELTTGVPTLWPLKLTSTVSVGLKPWPLAVMDVPGAALLVDSVRPGCAAGCGVWVALGTGVSVACAKAALGSNSTALHKSASTVSAREEFRSSGLT